MPEKSDLAKYLKQEEIETSIKALPNGKAPGIDGIPHELWKSLNIRFQTNTKEGRPGFDIIKTLTRVFNDIEKHGMAKGTDFAKGWMCPLYKKGDT